MFIVVEWVNLYPNKDVLKSRFPSIMFIIALFRQIVKLNYRKARKNNIPLMLKNY